MNSHLVLGMIVLPALALTACERRDRITSAAAMGKGSSQITSVNPLPGSTIPVPGKVPAPEETPKPEEPKPVETVIDLKIPQPMPVKKTELKLSAETIQAIDTKIQELRKIKASVSLFPEGADYAANGKIYSSEEIVKMPAGAIRDLLGANYCAILGNDVYAVAYKFDWRKFKKVPSSIVLKGTYRAETLYNSPANLKTEASLGRGNDKVEQLLQRDYGMTAAKGERTFVFCFTDLVSKTTEEADAKLKAYDNTGSFGPLKAALGRTK